MNKPKNILLTIAYDGSAFHGWQRQPGARTVQGVLEGVLSEVLGEEASVAGTSRTDAGVHALGQCATLRTSSGLPAERIPIAANDKLTDIHIMEAKEMPEGFHARFDAVSKTYLYRFAVAPALPIFMRNYVCLLKNRPNIGNMEAAARLLVGTHDFACFQAAGGAPRETTVRTVFGVRVWGEAAAGMDGGVCETVCFEVRGDGFLYNMVRIMAGTLLDVGLGKISPGSVGQIIAGGDRRLAGPTAPPQGLYLKEVEFGR